MPWGRSKTADDVGSAPVGDLSVPTDAAAAAAAAGGTTDAAATGAPDTDTDTAAGAAGAAAGAGATGSQPRGKVKGFGSKFRVGRGRASSADDTIKSTSSTVERNGARTPTSPGSPGGSPDAAPNASTGAGGVAAADDSSSGEEEETLVEILTPEEQAEQAKLDRWVM